MNESTVYVLAGMGGLSINDAMTYGLPVVCSVCDSTERDLVTDGVNGLFFKEDNADSLSDKLNKLLPLPNVVPLWDVSQNESSARKSTLKRSANVICKLSELLCSKNGVRPKRMIIFRQTLII